MRKPVFKPCYKCDNGFIYSNEGYEKVTKCQCLITYQKLMYAYVNHKKANIPESIFNYSIDSYIGPDKSNNVPKVKKIVEKFRSTFYNKVLYFYGDAGTQKTTIALWIARELLKERISTYYCFMNSLVEDAVNNQFEDEKDLMEKYYKPKCLIIDRAFDKDQMTVYKSGYQLPFLDNFLRKRIEVDEKCTIIISNSDIDQISSHKMNSDIEDLIRRKTKPYDTILHFEDHYSIKDYFEDIDIWS